MKPERISFWKNNKNWTVYQLMFLLKEQEPVSLNDLDTSIKTEYEQELANWKLFVKNGPRNLTIDEYPLTTPANSTELLDWVASLDGIAIPEIWHPLLSQKENQTCNEDPCIDLKNSSTLQQLGDGERENLLAIIGALALVVADKKTKQTGQLDKPNYSGIAKLVIKTHGKVPGLAGSTLRGKFSEGIQELMKNGVAIFEEKKIAS